MEDLDPRKDAEIASKGLSDNLRIKESMREYEAVDIIIEDD